MTEDHAWVHINTRQMDEPVVMSISIGSIPQDMLVLEITPDDWSKMLGQHGQPVTAQVRWMPVASR